MYQTIWLLHGTVARMNWMVTCGWWHMRAHALPPVLEPGRGPALITGPLSSESLLGRYRPPSSPLGRCQLGKTPRPFGGRGPGRAGPRPARWGGPPGRRGGAGPGPERKCINKLQYVTISHKILFVFKNKQNNKIDILKQYYLYLKQEQVNALVQFNNNGRVRNKKW